MHQPRNSARSLESVEAWLPSRLASLAEQHGVPGAAIAISYGGRTVDAATGVLNLRTGVAVTADSLFQIGSVTKIFTATLVMQLVADGRLDLDVPVVTYLAEFRTADRGLSDTITARHLLTHTGGFEGDVFVDTGRGDDALEKLLPILAEVEQFSAPGVLFSYSNAGYCVLGRLIEVLLGTSYEDALRVRIAEPLGFSYFATSADEAILFRSAVGHIRPARGADPEPVRTWSLPRSGAAAGSTLAMSAADLAGFGAFHLGAGSQRLTAQLMQSMRSPQMETSVLGLPASARGLGWAIYECDTGEAVGHAGATIGQYAQLRLVPREGLVVALLMNGGDHGAVSDALLPQILNDLGGVKLTAPLSPADVAVRTPERYVGRYESGLVSILVSVDAMGRLWADLTPQGAAVTIGQQPERYELALIDGDRFVPRDPEYGHDPHVFVGLQSDRPRYLHTGRAHRRRSS